MVQSAARDGAEDRGDAEGPGVGGQGEQADEEGDVAEFGDQEGLDGGGAGLGGLPVVADQEVRADAHDFPADQQHDQVARVHDEEHRGGEEGDESGVGGVAGVVAQIARRVDLHAGGDDADEYGDEGGEAVDVQGEFDRDRAGGRQLGGGADGLVAALAHGDEDGDDERGEGREYGEGTYEAGGRAAEEESGHRAEERQEGDEDGEAGRGHAAASAFSSAGTGVPSEPSSSGPSLSGP